MTIVVLFGWHRAKCCFRYYWNIWNVWIGMCLVIVVFCMRIYFLGSSIWQSTWSLAGSAVWWGDTALLKKRMSPDRMENFIDVSSFQSASLLLTWRWRCDLSFSCSACQLSCFPLRYEFSFGAISQNELFPPEIAFSHYVLSQQQKINW